jgi:PAS domain S-box-containing protein
VWDDEVDMSSNAESSADALQALVSTLPLVVYTATLDSDPRPRFVSPKVEELLGIPAGEFTFDDLRARVHPDDRDRVVAAFEAADTHAAPLTLEYRFVRPDGRVVWIEDNSRVVTVAGEPLAQGYLLDITERRRTHEMLERNASVRRRVADVGRIALEGASSVEVVRLCLETMREGIEADVGSYLELVDGQLVATQTFGWNAVGAVALPGTPAHDAFTSGVTSIGATEPANPDSLLARMGIRRSIAVPVAAKDGPCVGVLTIHLSREDGFSEFDVNLVEQTAHLIGAAVGRERLEQRLRAAQRLEAVGQLAAGIAHDFNNLLQAISGYTELAAARADERGAGYLAHVAYAAASAKDLTAQLLAYSRKQAMQPRRLRVADVISSVVPMLHPLLGEGIELDVAADEELIVFADETRLENTIINIAANARDAMPHGGKLQIAASAIHVDEALATDRQVSPGAYAAVRMTDTGEGMTPEVKERIFEPFFTTKSRDKGTGLGLASVVGTIEQSNGFVTVESAVGEGTTMTVFLPLAAAA